MALLFVRHGSTGANAGDSGGGFSDKDYFRGWSSIPLSTKGLKSVAETAEWFKKLNIPFSALYSSDLYRAMQTSAEIGKALNIEPKADPRLRPLNVGELTGQEITPEREKVLEAAHKNKDMTIPGGETYNDFIKRYTGILQELLPQAQHENIIVVAHHRNLLALPHLFHGVKEPPTSGPPVPGGVVALTNKKLEVLFEPSGQEKYDEKAKS